MGNHMVFAETPDLIADPIVDDSFSLDETTPTDQKSNVMITLKSGTLTIDGQTAQRIPFISAALSVPMMEQQTRTIDLSIHWEQSVRDYFCYLEKREWNPNYSYLRLARAVMFAATMMDTQEVISGCKALIRATTLKTLNEALDFCMSLAKMEDIPGLSGKELRARCHFIMVNSSQFHHHGIDQLTPDMIDFIRTTFVFPDPVTLLFSTKDPRFIVNVDLAKVFSRPSHIRPLLIDRIIAQSDRKVIGSVLEYVTSTTPDFRIPTVMPDQFDIKELRWKSPKYVGDQKLDYGFTLIMFEYKRYGDWGLQLDLSHLEVASSGLKTLIVRDLDTIREIYRTLVPGIVDWVDQNRTKMSPPKPKLKTSLNRPQNAYRYTASFRDLIDDDMNDDRTYFDQVAEHKHGAPEFKIPRDDIKDWIRPFYQEVEGSAHIGIQIPERKLVDHVTGESISSETLKAKTWLVHEPAINFSLRYDRDGIHIDTFLQQGYLELNTN